MLAVVQHGSLAFASLLVTESPASTNAHAPREGLSIITTAGVDGERAACKRHMKPPRLHKSPAATDPDVPPLQLAALELPPPLFVRTTSGTPQESGSQLQVMVRVRRDFFPARRIALHGNHSGLCCSQESRHLGGRDCRSECLNRCSVRVTVIT